MAGPSKYESASEAFFEKLVDAVLTNKAPWQRDWSAGPSLLPSNPVSGTTYSGLNQMSLWITQGEMEYPTGDWLTFEQCKELTKMLQKPDAQGTPYLKEDEYVHVAKGQKGTMIRFPKGVKETTLADGSTEERPIFGYTYVWNLAQIANVPERWKAERQQATMKDHERCDAVEALIKESKIPLTEGQDVRCPAYSPVLDVIKMPSLGRFESAGGYYVGALHELVHATGHAQRLDRKLTDMSDEPGSKEGLMYRRAREELTAEIGAMMLGQRFELGYSPQNHAAYLQGFAKELLDSDRGTSREQNVRKVVGWLQEGFKGAQAAVGYMESHWQLGPILEGTHAQEDAGVIITTSPALVPPEPAPLLDPREHPYTTEEMAHPSASLRGQMYLVQSMSSGTLAHSADVLAIGGRVDITALDQYRERMVDWLMTQKDLQPLEEQFAAFNAWKAGEERMERGWSEAYEGNMGVLPHEEASMRFLLGERFTTYGAFSDAPPAYQPRESDAIGLLAAKVAARHFHAQSGSWQEPSPEAVVAMIEGMRAHEAALEVDDEPAPKEQAKEDTHAQFDLF